MPKKGWTTLTALLDVNKAYDRIWKQGLLHKLRMFKLSFWLCKLILNWLTDRIFQVRVNDTLSNTRPAKEGLPQGSPLSPILFNIFVADMSTQGDKNITTFQFADDTAIVARGKYLDAARGRLEGTIEGISLHMQQIGKCK